VIRRVVIATGEVTTLVGTPGAYIDSADGTGAEAHFNNPDGLACDQENLYVSDSSDHTIRKVVLESKQVTTLAGKVGENGNMNGSGADARFNIPSGLALRDSNTLLVADRFNHAIRRIDLTDGMVTTIADGDQVRDPRALAVDGAGNLFIASNSLIYRLDSVGAVTTLMDANEKPLSISSFGLAIDGSGNLYLTKGLGSIAKVAPDLMVPNAWTETSLVGADGQLGSRDGIGADARFQSAWGLAIDAQGEHLFVADNANDAIREVEIASRVVTTLAGAAGPASNRDGNGIDARFGFSGSSVGLTSDGQGNLFVASSFGCAIRQVSLATGEVTTLVGTTECEIVDGTGPDARLSIPSGIVSDGQGRLFVSDDSVIRQIEIATKAVTTVTGKAYETGETRVSLDGTRGGARFRFPGAITSDGGDNLYVIDESAVRKMVVTTGEVTTLAGKADEFGGREGIGKDARFNFPSGIAYDPSGNLFVTDSNQVVWKVAIETGAVSILAGAMDQRGSDNGIGSLARFHSPMEVASDGRGDLLVADYRNHAIRKVVIATGNVSTFAGNPAIGRITPGPLPAELSLPTALAVTPTGVAVTSGNSLLFVH
jgi:sugar lactone lactonase YvrE